jgi:hypothetical protein
MNTTTASFCNLGLDTRYGYGSVPTDCGGDHDGDWIGPDQDHTNIDMWDYALDIASSLAAGTVWIPLNGAVIVGSQLVFTNPVVNQAAFFRLQEQ